MSAKKSADEEKDAQEEEEELFVGDLVKISGVKADVSKALGDVGLQWEASMSAFLGQTGRVKTVQMKEGKQVVEVQLGSADGPSFAVGVAALELLGDEDEEDEEEIELDQNEEDEAEDGHMYRVNEKVRDLTKPKGKCATGIVTKVSDQGTCDVKYDDGGTRTGIPLKQLRPLEKAESDGTGLSYTSSHNEFDFTTGQLPTGVEAVGEGVELKPGKGGETYLVMRKGTYLRLPFKGMRHERLRPGEAIPSYTLTLEFQLDSQHPQLEHPWSVYQASFPEVHETDELCFVAKARTEFPQWMVGTDIDGRLPVTLEMDPKSKALAGLLPGTVVQQCGEVLRLPSGARRVPVKFKRQALTAVEEEEITSQKKKKPASGGLFKAPPPGGGFDGGKGFDLFNKEDEDEEDPGEEASNFQHKMHEDEVTITVHAGYWGESTQAGCATSIKVSSNGIQRTLTFFPGLEHGAVRVEGEPDADLGFKPATQRYHILSLTMRQTGSHSFSISDGGDPTNVWSSDFRLHGWLDDLYGAAAVSVFDPEDRELELGHEMAYQAEGEHKLRLVTLGDQVFETDELDPQGWVSFNRTCLEPVDKANTKASRHPTCHVKVKDKILDKRLFPGRWHSLTVTVDSVRDEMCVYLDGIAVDKPIDIFESFGMGRGGGREGKDRRKGISETGAAEYEAYSYGGFGYSFQSPFAVPQEGFLLFASSSIRSMPGGTKLRKAIFRNSILNAKTIEDQYVNSRHKRRPPQIPQNLTLAPIMKKKAIPLWVHGSYVAEFCNPFVPAAGGPPQHLYSVFCMALEATVDKMSVGKLWTASDISGCKKVLGLFREMDILMRKWHSLWTAPGDQLPGLSAIYLRRLAQARAELQPGGRLLVPLGIRLQKEAQMLMLIMERKASGNYRFLVVNSSPIGLKYHASDAGRPPKIRYRSALELDDVPATRAEDEGFWMMLVVTAVQPCDRDQLPLYDKLLPWLCGAPLEHHLATVAPVGLGAAEWRSPQCAATDGWRYLTFSLRVLLLEVAQFSTSKAKLLKWHMREQLLSFAATDLAQAQSLSVSEKRLLRLGLSQLSLASVKVSGNLELEALQRGSDGKEPSMTVLSRAHSVVTEIEAAIERKPRPYGFEDPSVLPLLDLVQGAQEAPAHDWGLHPFFERLLREQRSPGQKVGIPLLVPINLLEMPETIPDLEAAVRALRLTEELCAKLCFVGHERCKFSNFLRVALLQHVFTELMPLPLGPLAEKPPLNLTDPVWAPKGCNELHPQLTRGGQLELMQVLLRLAEHFVSASCGLHASGSFDGVKIVVLGAIAAMADRVLRIRTVLPGIPKPKNDGPIEAEAEPNPSLVSELINGVGQKGWKAMAVDPSSFMRQSETIEATTPEISVARTAVASYFSEVKKALEVPSGKDRTLFDWDQHGWMLWVNKETGLKKLVQTICSNHLLQAGGGWADLAAGSDPYLVHTWPEFQCYRDIIFYWKYFLCTDLRVFPKVNEFLPQTAYLRWQVVDEQKAFGCPPNRGKVFMVTGLGKDHLLKHDVPPHRPKPAASGLRWPSAALPSHHTKTPVRTEDDLLYMRSLPTFNEMLRASDSEALLSFLTVPYIRMPLVLAFFTTGDRVNSLFDTGLQEILQAVILEPGKLLEPMNWAAAPENVPANSSAEQELVASPYGQLLTELACAPGCLLAYLAKLLELALVLANSAMSQTVGTILFTLRVAARVESSAVYLLQHAEGKLPATGPRPGALPSSAALLAELRAGRQRLRAIFMEAEGWLDAWLDELHDLACKAAAAAGEDLKSGAAPKAKNKAAQSLDQYMKTSCNIHAHLLLLLRNVPEDELDERSVGRILSSFTFLSLHHTFNQNFLDIPETELFEVFQHHRRGLVRWFEKQRKNSEYGRFNRVLQQVHQQFSTIDSSSAVDTALFEWGVVKGDARNAGRYAIVGPKRSDAERGEVAQTASNDNAWIELNIQLLQVTVRGRHVTPLEADTCDDGDFKEVLTSGAGRQAETVQCAALLSTNLVRVRELLSQPYRITRWEGTAAGNLPFTGDYVRLYDMEDFEEHEAWVPQLFEPVRLKFFVPPAVPQNILFFLLEETDPSASVIVLAAVHPKVRGKVWKEVVVFRDLRAVQIFKIDSYGHQHYRSLEYTTNARYCLAEKQPNPNDRDDPWPDWGRYEAGVPDLNLQDKPPSVVMSRTIVKDVHSDGSAGAGSGKADPLDDSEEWSDGEPSDDETEQERKERTVWERSQKEGEQYLPKRFLKGLLPEGLLEKYFIYQENESPWRAIRGYPKTLEGEEERDPDHILEIKLIKVKKVPSTGHRGWCALVRKRWKTAGRKPWFLLNLLYAKEGTPLHSLARTLVRLENLSFILAWTEQDPRDPKATGYDPPIHFVEMPRLLLSFTVKRAADGRRGLWSLDHAELSVPLGPPTFARTQAAKLLEPMPHSLLLQTSNQQYFALLPNIKVHRPHVGTDPFSTELVLERGNSEWWGRAKNKTFLYPVHASRSFLQTPTLASALYVMMLRWMNRDYRGVAALVSAVGTDAKYEEDEMQIFKHLGRISDPHPDSHANRLQVSLAVADANMELPWDLLEESAGYLGKIAHVTARSRLSEDYELRVLQLCSQIRKCLEIIENEVGVLRQRWWGQWGAARIKRFVELLQSEKERKLANFQEAQEVEQWLRQLLRKMRASQLPQTKEEIRSMAIEVFGDYSVDPGVELALDNRSRYLERLGGRDGARPGEELYLHCPRRAKESLWQTHQDQNVLLCSLFDLLWEVLGAEKVLRRDVEEEEGPEIPMMRRLPFPMAISTAFEMLQGKMSLKDYGSAPKTWAFLYSLFTCSTGARLSRAKETALSHQHTYSTLLLHLMPGSRHHGVLASLLHILAQNPNICESMPMLTKPKKVRLVGQWKLKLTEIHQFVVQAADGMQLVWPPSPESFQELPRPMQSRVDEAWFQRPDQQQGGLCSKLLFAPEIPAEGACLLGCPSLAVLSCTERWLEATADMSGAEVEALATVPLQHIAQQHLVDTPPSSLLAEEMPFDLANHPTAKHRVAISMLSRLDREVKLCARMRNARQKPTLTMLQSEHVKAIANGEPSALAKAREQMARLREELLKLKSKDEEFVAMAITKSFADANDIDLGPDAGGPPLRDRLRFWLLRHADLEATLWFEHLCCGLLSPEAESDFAKLNPFLKPSAAAGLLSRLTQMMLVAGRIIQTCRALDSCQDLSDLLANPEAAGSPVALAAGLGEKANVLSGLLASKRTYINKVEGSKEFKGIFDPHFLVFEFVTGFLLRPRQVEMVNEFSDALRSGKSSVKQMIMGAGKTSVVSPLLALMHANGSRIVCLVVPPALISLSRSVLQNCFSTVVQKRVSTFKCDRSLDLEVALSERLGRIVSHGDVLLTTPGDVKSLELRFLEQLDLANDRQARRNTTQMRRECVQMGRALELMKKGVCMIDEVDLVLHPLRSELNFPIGPKNLIEHAPDRWRVVLHLLDGFFSVEKGRVPPHLKDSLRAKEILHTLGEVIHNGADSRYLQRNPHLILLNEEFYHHEVKPIMCDWLMLWLSSEHVGRAFEQASTREDRGLTEDEVRAYLLHRVSPQRLELEASMEVWQGLLARAGGGSAVARSNCAWIMDVMNGAIGTRCGPGRLELPRPDGAGVVGSKFEPVARSDYFATRVEPLSAGNVRLVLEETEEGAAMRGDRVEKLPAKDAKSMNLSWDWLQVYLPFSLQKIDRVTFGIMSSEQVAAALAEQPLMPLTRAKLAIPFVGKDVPSQSSEFAHPDVVIGLTTLAYRYEGLRREDFDEVLGMLCDRLEGESGAVLERPTSLLWKNWVEESGADFCVKQAELDEQTSSQVLGLEEQEGGKTQKPDRLRPRVLPLHLLERRNEANMAQLFQLLSKLPSAVHFYLEQSVFPQFMRFQDEKLSASGQDLGGSILFGQRIGFSGTPSDLMPRELGQCDYEPGSEGEMVSTMTDTKVVTFEAIEPGWNVELLLDSIIEASHQGRCNALIDTGALITGLTNQEVAEYLLGFGPRESASSSPSARPAPSLPDTVDGVVFLDEDGGKKILLRATREVTKLADSGVPAQKRFAFYDQVHTTGMDIQHKLDAVAALTLGKDMCWRDYVQGAYRMRGIGRGQRICLYVIPEVVELISRDLALAGIEQKLAAAGGGSWTSCERGRLLAVAAWLLVNSIRTERIQFAMLQLQNLGNVWRRNAFKTVMSAFEMVTSEGLKDAVQVFKEPIAFTLPSGVPKARGVHEVVQDRVEEMAALIAGEEDQEAVNEVKKNVLELSALADEKEGEAGLETEQQREQEQERQQEQEQEEEKEQEIEIEKFVDLMHCRDDEEPESWPLISLASEEKAKQFYEAQRFKLWKRRPLENLPGEARISTNWFNPQWSGFRRVKNVFVQMEWVPDFGKAVRCKEPLQLDAVEELEMHKKLRTAWDLLMRGEGIELPREAQQLEVQRSEHGKKPEKLPPPPGELGAARLMELLAASFDWDASLRDPQAALAYLGRRPEEKLDYEDMVRLLLDARFRTRDEGRCFVLLSLAEAETLRRVLHARLQEKEPILKQAPSASLALRCVFAGNAVLDGSLGFQAGPSFQCRMMHQLARFLDGQSFFRPPEISVLLRALQRNRPFERRRFFEGLGGCRRRGASGGWEQQPVAEVLRPWLEFEQVLARVRAVRLHAAIYGQGLSVQMAFQRFDVNQSGLLEPMELCRALRELGFAFDAFEVANWIEAVDTTGNHCADYSEFFAFCKLQVDSLLGIGFAPKAALGADASQLMADRPPSAEVHEVEPSPVTSANPRTLPGPPELIRHTSDIVRPDEIEEELLERRAAQKRQEAEEARAKAEVEEAIEVLVEEELGMNPTFGEGFGEWDFRGQLLPKDTFALGVVDLIPESWGTKGGKNFLLFDQRAGLAVQRIQLAPNGNSDRRINKYSLTLWFRTPMLPSKADRMLLLDLPRGEMESEEETATGGTSSVFVWRGGVVAPEGYHEPSLQRKDADASSHLRQMLNGEWRLKFTAGESGEKEKKVEMMLSMEPSGRLLLSPSRGAASRKGDAEKRNCFGVRLKLQKEVRDYVELHCNNIPPQEFSQVLDHLWQKIRGCCNVAMEGRSWSEIGWPGSQNQVKRKALKDLKNRGEVIIARGLPALDALRIARGLKEHTAAGAEFVEDKSMANEIKIGDMVQLVAKENSHLSQNSLDISLHLFQSQPWGGGFGAFNGGLGLALGEAGKVTNVNFNRGQVHVETKKGGRWYPEDDVMKVDPKALGLVPLTDSEWAGLPSTRANYVCFSQQLPNPLLEGGWVGKGRAEKSEETSAAEIDLNFDVVQMGFMSSYVDAQVFYAEAGLEIRGQWRTADGSTGQLRGTKALAGLALGGLWHVELQTGAESMQHAWNCWFSSFPPSSGSNTSTIQVSGSALAGPMLQEGSAPENAPPALHISGEMTGKGLVSFTMRAEDSDLSQLEALGAKNWIGSTWEGELGSDRWLRGSWRCVSGAGSSGRWRARHIGRQAVHQTLKPMVDSGAEWEPKRCEIRSATAEVKTGLLKKGMKVKLSKVYKTCSDAQFGPLKEGMTGVVTQENQGSDQPLNIKAPNGQTWWYQEKALVPAFALQDESRLFNPLGDEFEGVSFTRFPVTQGSAYVEVRVVRLGRTMPMLGFGLMEEKDGKTILVRMAIIEGRTSRKLDLSGRPQEVPELERKNSKDSASGKETKARRKKPVDEDEDDFDLFGDAAEEEPPEEEAEEVPDDGKKKKKGWDFAKPYGDKWQEGDVICCQLLMPSGIIAFGLNGDFQAPMGTAFDLKLPPNSRLCLMASAGENGRLRVNMGQVAFSFPPPSQLEPLLPDMEDDDEEKEGEAEKTASAEAPDFSKLEAITVPASMGLGESMHIRPLWQVKLPKAVKAWPVYALPSRDSQGRRAMKDGEMVEQIALESGGGWVQHQAGWSPCRMVVVGHEYEALKPTPAWVGIDKQQKEKVRKAIKRVVHGSFDTELCSQHCWNFRGSEEAHCSNGPNMLVSMESAASGILRWCIKSENGNKAIEVGVVPADKAEEGNFLFESCDCGVKSSGTKGGSDKKVFDMYQKYIEVIADLDVRQMKVLVGDSREQMVEVKSADIPFEEDIKLAITGWNNTKLRLEVPQRDKAGDSDESEGEEEDEDGLVVTSCGNAVQASTWHVATMVVDLPASTFKVYLDGELHLNVRDPGGLMADGRFSIDPREGMMLFSAAKRGGSGLGSADWRAGGHLRSMRLDSKALSQFDVWAHQLPKGVWICRCTARNAADARVCWRCRNTKTRSGARPPGDADPRVEGLTVVTADSFRELVLDSQKHVLLVASASWCPPCQQLKPLIHRLAQLLSAEPQIAIAVIDTDENELQSRYFPEPHIPNVKFFLQGQKRQPVSVPNASGMSLDELAGLIEQHTGISIQQSIEKGFPAYAERVGVHELLNQLKRCALTKPIPRAPGQLALKSLASFLYNELITGCKAASSQPKLLPPPALQRAISAKTPGPGAAPPQLLRAVSGGPERRRAQPSFSPTLMMGVADPRLTERLMEELDRQLLHLVRVAQPEDFKSFLTSFLLKASCPSYSHANFYNALSRLSWQVPPMAEKLVAATRIFRFLLRWCNARRLLSGRPPLTAPWAPPPPQTEMSAAAQRHSWRRIEIALANEEHRHGLAEMALLLDRGLPPDTAPFGLTPLLLAAAIGHLPATQFLYVRGASPHVVGGQPPLLPVEAAARHNHLRIVEFLMENGSVGSRALHFAAAGGAMDVAHYLLAKGCSASATVQGLSPVAVALISRQHSLASLLLPQCDEAALGAPLSDEGCAYCGLASGSTLAHLAGSVGGLCEHFVLGLLRLLPSTAQVKNSRNQTPLDLMPSTLRIAVKPALYAAMVAASRNDAQRTEAVSKALKDGKADPLVVDPRGFDLLNLAAYAGEEKMVDVLLTSEAAKQLQNIGTLSALMWAHWCGHSNIVLKLTSHGASLSNADLEGLQRLRSAAAELEDKEKKVEGSKLLWPETSQIWHGCWPTDIPPQLSPSTNTYLYSARPLMQRMIWGAGRDHGIAMPRASATSAGVVDEDEKTPAAVAAKELLDAIKLSGAEESALATAQLIALRLTAEGKVGLSPANIVALNLFLSDASFHSECSNAFSSQFSQSPAPAVRERAADLQAAHAELSNALQALPARKVVCFRALRVPGSSLRDVLRGHRMGMDCYRPGSIVMWRHPSSCTQDPSLAEELALHGEPSGACGVVFKIRRAASARPVAEFSTTPEHQEVLFPPGSIFRVLGFYPCNSQSLRKGTGSDGPWSAELGSACAAAAQSGDALTWEEVCRSRSAMVLLDEEDASVAVQRSELMI